MIVIRERLHAHPVLSFVKIRPLNWIGQVITMNSERKVRKVFKNNPQGIDEESNQTQLL
jgi:hypothetical protein